MKACLNGHVKVVRYLIQKGAKSSHSDKEGWTSLHNAASRGHIDAASLLIVDGEVDCNPVSSGGFTPISVFCLVYFCLIFPSTVKNNYLRYLTQASECSQSRIYGHG